jgi:hypothetical protein
MIVRKRIRLIGSNVSRARWRRMAGAQACTTHGQPDERSDASACPAIAPNRGRAAGPGVVPINGAKEY